MTAQTEYVFLFSATLNGKRFPQLHTIWADSSEQAHEAGEKKSRAVLERWRRRFGGTGELHLSKARIMLAEDYWAAVARGEE